MANPLDRAGLYQRYKDAQRGRGIESIFQEEGVGLGPLDYDGLSIFGYDGGDSLSDLIKQQRKYTSLNPFRSDETKKLDDATAIANLRKSAESNVQKEIGGRLLKDGEPVAVPKGLAAALEQMRINQGDRVRNVKPSDVVNEGGLTPIIRDKQGNVIGGGNPLFKSPETDLSELAKKELRKQNLSEIYPKLSSESLALQGNGLDELADQLRPVLPSGPKSDETSIVTVQGPGSKEKKEDRTAEEFRADEEKIAKMTGGDPVIGETKQGVLDNSFSEAMDDYINAVRGTGPEDKERTLDEYKAEFAEATGIDISGKVDKSSALMAFGLALMQNRAGSGFNVGKMFSAIGAAGEKALPALEKAKEKAQTAAIAAGKYALQSRDSDRAKDEAADLAGKSRGKYWVYKKGGKGTEFANFDEGEFVDLNPFELNKLIENKDFDKEYEFIDASDRMSILEKRSEGVDLGDMWGDYKAVSLIGGSPDDVPPELQVLAAVADANYKGLTPTRFKIAEDPKAVARRFAEYQKSINSGAANFESLLKSLNEGVTIPQQFVSSANKILVAFGIGETDDIEEAKRRLNNLAIDEATNILKESGKTLSDNDRKLVKERVGQISWGSADVGKIKRQLEEIYYLTVMKPQENLDTAMSWLETNAGIQFGSATDDIPKNQEELDAMNAKDGTNLTMDDFKKSGT